MPKRNYTHRSPIVPIGPSIAYIPLTRGLYALVDAQWATLGEYLWCAVPTTTGDSFYAVRYEDGKKKSMHRIVSACPEGMIPDHKNRNGLDNREANLRIATVTQNGQNTRLPQSNTSGYKGVHFNKPRKKWVASLKINGKRRYLGNFSSAEEAGKAYQVAATQNHKEFARFV